MHRESRKITGRKLLHTAGRCFGYAVAGAAGLALASPGLLLLFVFLALLAVVGTVFLGCALGLAAMTAMVLHALIGLPFWFWMIFTVPGALLLCGGLLASAWGDGGNDDTGAARPRGGCTPLTWLLAALLFADWWGERTNG
ncbi:MAG: hypothetical protein QME13_07730 [Thermoanaerobacteraceae bacterium]|jgi:hypothetical protein|nr:hypothetical protein [Thermoanaerobacteraceae bacterium]